MSKLKQSLLRIPYWAYLLVLTVIIVNSVYLFYKGQEPADGLCYEQKNGQWVVINYDQESKGYKAGIRPGDIIVSVNSKPFDTWLDGYQGKRAGDSGIYHIIRDKREIQIRVVLDSYYSNVLWFFWSLYIIMLLLSISSLNLLVKKPDDKPVRLFFIYLQLFTVTMNAWSIPFSDIAAVICTSVFSFITCQLGSVLIHFHLLFPKPVPLLSRFKGFPVLFYAIGSLVYVLVNFLSKSVPVERMDLIWLSLTFLLAMATAVYQFITIKDTLTRNQLRIIIIGSYFGFITPVLYTLFWNYINQLNNFLYMIMIPHGVGSMIMICCILIAIFRYRIWEIEVFIRKALLYLGATAFIILFYLLMIWLVDHTISQENNITRFLILAVSVILFLLLRDRIQRIIDRLFHRESYDSATVVSDFEAKLAGIYRFDEMKQKIVQSIDEIFHFKSFVFNLKKNGLIYEAAFVYGTDLPLNGSEYEINREFEEKLTKSKVFSPEELNKKPPILESAIGELVVPLIRDDLPDGFFICGQKKSERIYSQQDIRVLLLLARRVIALLQTAELYQRDIERQLMLEHERTRISQDMHDDVGASLTRISILSELVKNNAETKGETKQWLGQISDTSREVMEEMNQIIWALNPKNDTLEGLIAYIRRFANEYLEPTSISCAFNLPEAMTKLPLTVEVRRNIYLVIREALHNVVKHSDAKHVRISLKMNERNFKIAVKDDGKGFDPGKLEFPGNGLINMKKRMADIDGEFAVISIPGEGTEITLLMSPLWG